LSRNYGRRISPGNEVEFDPDEAERIAFKEDALSDEDARESIIDL
jgi:hypothetical protein